MSGSSYSERAKEDRLRRCIIVCGECAVAGAGHSGGCESIQSGTSAGRRAPGTEYTSRAWDDALVPAWGPIVVEAVQDVRSSEAS